MSDSATTADQVRSFAKKVQGPFTGRSAFENLDDIEDIQTVNLAINGLFKQGELVRRKPASGPGYEYIWHEFATSGFEAHAGHKLNGNKTESITVPVEKLPQPPTAPAVSVPSIMDTLLGGGKVSATPKPHAEDPAVPASTSAQTPSAEAIANAIIARLKPLLAGQPIAAELGETRSSPMCAVRVSIQIDKIDITLEGI